MATIDIRATVTCSLGTLISGSLSDDYIQGSGLVKTRGQCELVGLHTPAVGTLVTFSHTSNGVTTPVPRVVRVLSSFADPYRKITKVELGCKLTYFDNVTPAPTVDGVAAFTSGLQQQCLNGYLDYAADTTVPVPVTASGVMNTCLTKLGLTASSNPLTNVFNVSTLDLSPGYVSILNDLLFSESHFGYLDENETLQIRSLNAEGGTGPVITSSQIIDLDAIGVGDLPGEAVVVRYDSLTLKTTFDTTNTVANSQTNWEYEETTGDPQTVDVRYTSNGIVYIESFSFVPHTTTTTTYGPDLSWNSLSCVIFSRGEGADLSNSVIKRVTTQRTLVAESANSYCAQVFGIGGIPGANITADITTEEEYEYNEAGEVIRRTTSTYEPFFKWAGGLGVDFVYTTTYVTLSSLPVLVEKVVEEYVNIYAPRPKGVYLNPGEQYVSVVDGQKITTTTYRNWALTIGGQQGSASIKDTAPFTSASQCSAWLSYARDVMVMVDSQVRTNRGRLLLAGQLRSSQSSRIGQSNGSSGETTAQLAYVMGSASAERFITFAMPYQSDDTFTSTGAIQKGDAKAKALNFGRIQNRLLLGNRNGVNLQLHPNSLPAAPFDPLYLSDGSLMVQYRANGMNWAFSTEGVVAGVDALFWGVAGGTGTAWVPVAPGITSFPPLPTITPPVSGSTVSTTSVSYLTPAWNEQVALKGTTSTTASITAYPYTIGLLDTTAISATTRTLLRIPTLLASDPTSYNLSGHDARLLYRYVVRGEATSFILTRPSDTNLDRVRVVIAAPVTLTTTGQSANLKYSRLMPMETGTFAISGQDASSFTGKSMTGAVGAFVSAGAAASLIRLATMPAGSGSFIVEGRDTLQPLIIDAKINSDSTADLNSVVLTPTHQPGDLLIAVLMWRDNKGEMAVPSGWTLQGTYLSSIITGGMVQNLLIYTKIAGESEPASYTWVAPISTRNAWLITSVRNGLIDAVSQNYGNATTATISTVAQRLNFTVFTWVYNSIGAIVTYSQSAADGSITQISDSPRMNARLSGGWTTSSTTVTSTHSTSEIAESPNHGGINISIRLRANIKMPAAPAEFVVEGQSAGTQRNFAMVAAPLALALTGQAALLNYVQPVTYQYNVSISDAYANVNSAGKWFVNGTSPSFYKIDANGANARSFLSGFVIGQTIAISTNGTTFTTVTITTTPVDIFVDGNVWRLGLSSAPGFNAGASVWLKRP